MKKIVVIGTRGIPNIMGGVETHCEELFPRMTHKYDITVIRRTDYAKDNLQEYKGVKLANISSPKKKSLEAMIHSLKSVWAAKFRFHADILHIQGIGPALVVPIARLFGMKVVLTIHSHNYDHDKWGKLAKMILKFGETVGCRFANEVIVISNVIKNNIIEKYNKKNVYLIHNGVSAPNFIYTTHYLSELGVEPQKYILAVGRFAPEKNFHHLIEAFASLKNKNGYQLVLAGDADFEDQYSRKLKVIGRRRKIVLPGFIKGEKLQELLTHASVFVLPSSNEGLPISLLEAMSYNLPVLVSNIPPNLEIGLPQKSYFPMGNVEKLAAKLQQLINEKPEKREYPLDKYQWETIAEQTMGVYEKIAP
ncbi:MAG: glycosyltransferase family 4 protein [Bacteroidetes bacterium]|nr:glycosyltransferase family 4 protein [Bacteroidota bacterium]